MRVAQSSRGRVTAESLTLAQAAEEAKVADPSMIYHYDVKSQCFLYDYYTCEARNRLYTN